MKHSDLPWKDFDDQKLREEGSGCIQIIDKNGFNVAIIEDRGSDQSVWEENGKFIALACNSHYDLLEACKFALSSPDDEEAIRKLEAAILKVEGK